jgi:hypothetical protein
LNISIDYPTADATHDVKFREAVGGLADVLALAGEKPDAVREGGYAAPADVIDVTPSQQKDEDGGLPARREAVQPPKTALAFS